MDTQHGLLHYFISIYRVIVDSGRSLKNINTSLDLIRSHGVAESRLLWNVWNHSITLRIQKLKKTRGIIDFVPVSQFESLPVFFFPWGGNKALRGTPPPIFPSFKEEGGKNYWKNGHRLKDETLSYLISLLWTSNSS